MIFDTSNLIQYFFRSSGMLMRFFLLLLIVILNPHDSLAQEFEITLPEDYKPQKFLRGSRSSLTSQKSKVKKEKIDKSLEQLGQAELYLFSKTFDGASQLKRVEVVEKILYGVKGKGSIKERIERINKTISSGTVRINEGKIPEKIERKSAKKWWHFGSKMQTNVDFKLVRDGRRYFRSNKWAKAKDKFEQVLMIEPANIEALFTVAVCDFQIYSGTNIDKASYLIDEKMVSAREKLVMAKRLYILSGNTKQALEAGKYIEKIDSRRQKSAGPVKEF